MYTDRFLAARTHAVSADTARHGPETGPKDSKGADEYLPKWSRSTKSQQVLQPLAPDGPISGPCLAVSALTACVLAAQSLQNLGTGEVWLDLLDPQTVDVH